MTADRHGSGATHGPRWRSGGSNPSRQSVDRGVHVAIHRKPSGTALVGLRPSQRIPRVARMAVLRCVLGVGFCVLSPGPFCLVLELGPQHLPILAQDSPVETCFLGNLAARFILRPLRGTGHVRNLEALDSHQPVLADDARLKTLVAGQDVSVDTVSVDCGSPGSGGLFCLAHGLGGSCGPRQSQDTSARPRRPLPSRTSRHITQQKC